MKTIKLKLEIDLTNPAIVAAFNTLLVTMGDSNFVSAATQKTPGPPEPPVVEEVVQPEKPARSTKKVKEVPQVDTEKEKAKETLAELKEEKAAENVEPLEEEDTEEATPEPKTAKIDLAKVREALGLKVGEHREAIKAKLTEFGANNVTTLSSDHYEAMYEFLTGL